MTAQNPPNPTYSPTFRRKGKRKVTELCPKGLQSDAGPLEREPPPMALSLVNRLDLVIPGKHINHAAKELHPKRNKVIHRIQLPG